MWWRDDFARFSAYTASYTRQERGSSESRASARASSQWKYRRESAERPATAAHGSVWLQYTNGAFVDLVNFPHTWFHFKQVGHVWFIKRTAWLSNDCMIAMLSKSSWNTDCKSHSSWCLNKVLAKTWELWSFFATVFLFVLFILSFLQRKQQRHD